MDKSKIKKVVLAYSGGLDTSIIIPWLKENYNNCEVIAVSGNVGQADELEGLEEKALKTGASKLYIEDLTDEFVDEYIIPTVKAGAKYEEYMLGTSFARPIIAKRIVEIAKAEHADAICHGCTGKGNDQVRFELAIKAFAPDMPVIAPWREWSIKSREEEIDYAEAHDVPLKINRETNYSKDKNLWHLSHEGLDLEDAGNEPLYDKEGFLEMGVSPMKAPDKPTYITLEFDKGVPVALDGKKMSAKDIILARTSSSPSTRWAARTASGCSTSWRTGWWASSAAASTRPRAAPYCILRTSISKRCASTNIPRTRSRSSPSRLRSWCTTVSGTPRCARLSPPSSTRRRRG